MDYTPISTRRVLLAFAFTAFGLTSPVKTYAKTFYAEFRLKAGKSVEVPLTAEERAVYACNGAIEIDGQRLEPYEMAVLTPGAAVQITALADAHFVMIGGEPLTERHIYWNFVSSRPERIEQAKADWQKQDGIAFPKVPGDEVEFIPLPE